MKLPRVEPAQQALCSSQGIDGKGSREGRYAGARFVEHAEEGAHPLDMREGFAGQAGVELEEPEQAAGTDTEFSEPVPPWPAASSRLRPKVTWIFIGRVD